MLDRPTEFAHSDAGGEAITPFGKGRPDLRDDVGNFDTVMVRKPGLLIRMLDDQAPHSSIEGYEPFGQGQSSSNIDCCPHHRGCSQSIDSDDVGFVEAVCRLDLHTRVSTTVRCQREEMNLIGRSPMRKWQSMQEGSTPVADDHILAQPRNCSMDPVEHLVSGMRGMVAGTEQAAMSHSNNRPRGEGSANRRASDTGVESVADSHRMTGSQRGDRSTGVRRGHSRTPWHSAASSCRRHPQAAARQPSGRSQRRHKRRSNGRCQHKRCLNGGLLAGV